MSGRTGYTSKSGHPCYNTTRWRKLRLIKLGRQPLCEICERRGRVILATTVDHLKALSKGGEWFPHTNELVSLCTRCHQLKTARSDHSRVTENTARNTFAGSDMNGNPLDPQDPWNGSE